VVILDVAREEGLVASHFVSWRGKTSGTPRVMLQESSCNQAKPLLRIPLPQPPLCRFALKKGQRVGSIKRTTVRYRWLRVPATNGLAIPNGGHEAFLVAGVGE